LRYQTDGGGANVTFTNVLHKQPPAVPASRFPIHERMRLACRADCVGGAPTASPANIKPPCSSMGPSASRAIQLGLKLYFQRGLRGVY
jgi:hypothetical protein